MPVSLFARLMYRALLWKERQRAQREGRASATGAGADPVQLVTGRRGETLAYWYLRQAGYEIVARNWVSKRRRGELDLVGWDGPVLSFVEVKTRGSTVAGLPEAAVARLKQRRIVSTAREYLQRLRRRDVTYRFDIVSVLWDSEIGYHVRLIKDAFKER